MIQVGDRQGPGDQGRRHLLSAVRGPPVGDHRASARFEYDAADLERREHPGPAHPGPFTTCDRRVAGTAPPGRHRSRAVDTALVSAALAEFTEHGFGQMRMESIGTRVHLSR
jgi:hypothetical protein